MNLAIEYILRNDRIKKLASFPCSLFLEPRKARKLKAKNGDLSRRRIIVLLPEKEDKISVLEYRPSFVACLDKPKKTIVDLKDVYTHSSVILEDFKSINFTEQPFENKEKQQAELPLSALQESNYLKTLNTFFNPETHNKIKEDWLWNSFMFVHFNENSSVKEKRFPNLQKNFVQEHYGTPWKEWELWKKTFIFRESYAAELMFFKSYKVQITESSKSKEPISINAGFLSSRRGYSNYIGHDNLLHDNLWFNLADH